eukprot:1035199-Amphidinium_carterae.1
MLTSLSLLRLLPVLSAFSLPQRATMKRLGLDVLSSVIQPRQHAFRVKKAVATLHRISVARLPIPVVQFLFGLVVRPQL